MRAYKVNRKLYKDSNYIVFYTTFENPTAQKLKAVKELVIEVIK